MEWQKNQEVVSTTPEARHITTVVSCGSKAGPIPVCIAKHNLIKGCLRFLYGKREFPEYIPYKIISFLNGEIEVKPASHQYADYFFYFTLFYHVGLKKQIPYQMSEM